MSILVPRILPQHRDNSQSIVHEKPSPSCSYCSSPSTGGCCLRECSIALCSHHRHKCPMCYGTYCEDHILRHECLRRRSSVNVQWVSHSSKMDSSPSCVVQNSKEESFNTCIVCPSKDGTESMTLVMTWGNVMGEEPGCDLVAHGRCPFCQMNVGIHQSAQ